uniref:hypothetical protein n=1 Tax=uncultured Phenylobacterium sp. TaxID=349273 RepID=UPI0025DE9204
DKLLETAERWIVDVWRAQTNADGWAEEPRSNLFNDRDYALASTRGGSLPVLEHYRTYLEWHALWCAVGELLQTEPLSEEDGEDDWTALPNIIAREQLTVPPYWLADLTTPPPLLPDIWRGPEGAVASWLETVSDEEFRRALLPADRPGFLAVHFQNTSRSWGWRQISHIHSGLMSRETGSALVKALQSTDFSEDHYIPPEGHELGIDDGPYQLLGWLRASSGDVLLDDNDDSRNEIGNFDRVPGERVQAWKQLDRRRTEAGFEWVAKGDDRPVFIYEAWGNRMQRGREDRATANTRPAGSRLLMRRTQLAEMLVSLHMDLVVEVRIERADQGSRSDSEKGTEVAHERFYGLAADGELVHARGRLEPWTSTG